MSGVHPSSPLAAARRDAQALRDSGDLPAARRLLMQVLGSTRPDWGEDHPEVLATAQLLARLHWEADDPAAARRVLEEALAAGQRRLGDGDPLILAISFDLGSVAGELGNRHEARRNFSRVATAGPAVLGVDHPMVRAARDHLGDRPSAPALPAAEHLPPAPPPAPPAPAPITPAAPATVDPNPAGSALPAPPRSIHHVSPYSAEPDTRLRPYPQISPQQVPVPVVNPTPRGRGAVIVAAAAATVAAVAAVLAVVIVLADDPAPHPDVADGTNAAPTLAGDPPTDLRLRDDGVAVTVTWTDPSAGTVPFIVAGGRSGQTLGAMATTEPGETSYTVNGLNPRLDYCFAVFAVYSTNQYATSGQVCTVRATLATPTPR